MSHTTNDAIAFEQFYLTTNKGRRVTTAELGHALARQGYSVDVVGDVARLAGPWLTEVYHAGISGAPVPRYRYR